MATRSTIAYVKEDGSIDEVYCHWDGYIEHNGKILVESYPTIDKVKELISHGGISILENTLDDCIFYHRDCVEDLEITHYDNLQEYRIGMKQEYNYLFKDNQWYCMNDDENELVSIFTHIT